MAEATCRLFLEPKLFDYLESIPRTWAELGDIPITYLDQVIPSPYGMPPFKTLPDDWKVSDLVHERFSTFYNEIDVSSERVHKYYNVKQILGFNRRLKRILPYSSDKPFAYTINSHLDTLVIYSVIDKLKPNWQRTIPSDTNGVHCSW